MAKLITHTYAENKGQRSVGSKDRVERSNKQKHMVGGTGELDRSHFTIPDNADGQQQLQDYQSNLVRAVSPPLMAKNKSTVFPQFTHQTDRQTDRWDRQQVCSNTRLRFIDCIVTGLIINIIATTCQSMNSLINTEVQLLLSFFCECARKDP